MPRQQLDLNIVYEDDDLLVISKPAGLLVIPDRWDASKPTVVKLARAYLTVQAAAKGTIAAEPPLRIGGSSSTTSTLSGVTFMPRCPAARLASVWVWLW